MLSVHNLSFSYSQGPPVFENISFSVQPGDILCMLGPNGIGKTTLLYCIAHLLHPTGGYVEWNGERIDAMRTAQVATKIGLVPQAIHPSFDYTVLEYVVTGAAPRLSLFARPTTADYEIAKQALDMLQIRSLEEKSCAKLSGGEMQLVSIARAVTQKTPVLLMDEPTSHLDYGNQLRVLGIAKQLAKKGYTLILSTHNPDQVLLLDGKVAVFDRDAQLHVGTNREVMSDQRLSDVYETPIRTVSVAEVGRRVCMAERLKETEDEIILDR